MGKNEHIIFVSEKELYVCEVYKSRKIDNKYTNIHVTEQICVVSKYMCTNSLDKYMQLIRNKESIPQKYF